MIVDNAYDMYLKIKNLILENRYLVLVMILGAAFRLYNLGFQSLWFDELECVTLAIDKSFGVFWDEMLRRKNLHSHGYYFILHFISYFTEIDEFYARIPSAIFGIISLYLVYCYSYLVSYCRKTSLMTTTLWAFSGAGIYYAQEARGYSLSVFTSLILVLILMRMEKIIFSSLKINKKMLLLNLAVVFLLLLVDRLNLLVLFVFFLYYILRNPLKFKRSRYVLFFLFLLMAVNIPRIYEAIVKYSYEFSNVSGQLPQTYDYLQRMIFFSFSFHTYWHIGNQYIESKYVYLIFLVYIAILIITLLVGRDRESFKNFMRYRLLVPLLMIVVPVVVFIIINVLFSRNIFRERYLLFTLPSYDLFMSIILMQIKKSWIRNAMFGFLVVFFVSHFVFNINTYWRTVKTPYLNFFSYIKTMYNKNKKNDYIYNPCNPDWHFRYFLKRFGMGGIYPSKYHDMDELQKFVDETTKDGTVCKMRYAFCGCIPDRSEMNYFFEHFTISDYMAFPPYRNCVTFILTKKSSNMK